MLGFALGGVTTAQGLLRPLLDRAGAPVLFSRRQASLPWLLNLPAWPVVIAVALLLALALAWLPRPSQQTERWPWQRTGLALGVLGTAAWLAAKPTGWGYGLSMTGPTRSLLDFFLTGSSELLNWGVFMLVGLIGGTWASARARGPLILSVPSGSEAWRRLIGGLLMGVGGTLAGGCNIGNAFTGLALLALNPIVATAGIFLGVWLVSHRPTSLSSVP